MLLNLINNVSIPSNGSIQFLYNAKFFSDEAEALKSQSPLTGQFNFYTETMSNEEFDCYGLNPL